MKNRILESLILAIAVIAFGGLIHSGLLELGNRGRTVSVRGLAEKEVSADKVFWSMNFTEVGNDLSALSRSLAEKDSIVLNFFLKHGLAREDLTIKAPEIYDGHTNPYMDKLPKNRYTMTSAFTVATSKVDTVRKLQLEISELAIQGIALSLGEAQYEFTGLNEIKPQMIEEATHNAREAAEKFAKDSDSKLGKIQNAKQGLFSIDNRDENTPYIKNVRVVTFVDFALED